MRIGLTLRTIQLHQIATTTYQFGKDQIIPQAASSTTDNHHIDGPYQEVQGRKEHGVHRFEARSRRQVGQVQPWLQICPQVDEEWQRYVCFVPYLPGGWSVRLRRSLELMNDFFIAPSLLCLWPRRCVSVLALGFRASLDGSDMW